MVLRPFARRGDGDDLFADLGDLDQLDADARQKAEGESDEDFGDFDNEELDEFDENEFDHDDDDLDHPADEHESAFTDLEERDQASASASESVMNDLADFEVGGGFDDDDEDEDAAAGDGPDEGSNPSAAASTASGFDEPDDETMKLRAFDVFCLMLSRPSVMPTTR